MTTRAVGTIPSQIDVAAVAALHTLAIHGASGCPLGLVHPADSIATDHVFSLRKDGGKAADASILTMEIRERQQPIPRNSYIWFVELN